VLRRKIVKILAYSLAGLVSLLAIVVVGAVLFVQGERLAKIVNGVLPPMRGKIHFESIRWQPRLLWDLVTDRPTPMVIGGLLITDPEGTTVLDVPNLEVKVRLQPLIGGGGIILSDLHVGPKSMWLFGRMKKLKGIGFLASFDPKNPPPPSPPKPPGAPKEKGFVFQIVNADLDGFRVIFDFPGTWGFDLRDVHAPAWLLVDGEGFVGWEATNLEARQGGYLRVLTEELPFDSVKVRQVATLREYWDDIYLDLTDGRTGRSTLRGKGYFRGIYAPDSVSAINMHAEFDRAADALNAVAKPHDLTGLRIGGDDVKVVGDLNGPYVTLDIKAAIDGLDAGFDAYAAKQLSLRAGVKFDTKPPAMTVDVQKLTFQSPTGGSFKTALVMADDDITAKLDLDRFDTSSYLPKGLKKLAGKAHGHLAIAANIGEKKSIKLSELNLAYDRTAKGGGIPGSVRISGRAQASAAAASTSGLHVMIPGAKADVRGKVEFAKQLVDVGLRIGVSDLPRVLSTVKVDPLAKTAEVAVDVSGSLDRPSADGRIAVQDIGGGNTGIPAIGEFQTGFRLRGGTLTVDGLRADVAGGSLEGGGRARLFEKTISRMLAAPVIDFHLDGKNLSLEDLVTSGVVSGRVSFELAATGTAKKPKVLFRVPAGTAVEVLGQAWSLEGIEIEAGKDALTVRLCHVTRQAGGDLRVEGHVDLTKKPPALDWRIQIRDLPLGAILATAKVDAPVSGKLSIDLHATGTLAKPAVEGTIALAGVEAFDLKLGDAKLALTPTLDGGVAVAGTLFGRLHLGATAALGPKGPRAHATLAFEDLHVEDYVADLKEQGIASALTGQIGVDIQPGHLPGIDVLVSQIDASITRDVEQPDGSKTRERIWLKNASPLHVETDTEKVSVEQVRLLTPGGEFTLFAEVRPQKDGKGTVIDQAVNADVAGKLDLDLLQPLLREQFKSLRGGIALEVHARGSVKKPSLSGKVAIARSVHAEPRSFDQMIAMPSGAVRLTSSSVELSDLAVIIDNATLKVGGKVGLGPGFTPESVALKVGGEVSASVLQTIAPDAVSDVTGKATITADVKGKLDNPNIAARIDLGEIQMRLRGVSRQVAVQSGILELSSHEILLKDVRVVLDEEGELLIGAGGVRPGRIHIKSLRPDFVWDSLYLPLRGNRLGYRDGGVEVDDLSLAMQLSGNPTDGLTLSGDVRLVSGRYLQDFNVRNMVLSPRINESESSQPIWENQPLLEHLALNLRVRTEGDGFVVQNNLVPEMHVMIDLGIGGSISRPTISGEIRPTDGRFHIIALRGDFELLPNVNHVTFVPTKSIAEGDTPELNLEAQNIVVDAAGNEHTVLMKISGPINQATIDLSTKDGLDRNQTMLLLLSGRTTDETSGNNGQLFGMNQSSGLAVAGQASRDVVSNLVEPYIDDTLQMITGRKWNLRPTVGADGFEVKVQARATREFDMELSYLRGFQGQERYRAQGLFWFRDYLTGRVIGDRLTYSLQQGLPIQTNTFRLELTFEYPLRPGFLLGL
jgi:hypothetical protein